MGYYKGIYIDSSSYISYTAVHLPDSEGPRARFKTNRTYMNVQNKLQYQRVPTMVSSNERASFDLKTKLVI